MRSNFLDGGSTPPISTKHMRRLEHSRRRCYIRQPSLTIAGRFGLSAIDALHVAAAEALGADELVTTERPGKSLLRVTLLPIISIQP